MDHIENAGRKGYCLLIFFVLLFGLIGLIIYLYRYNFTLTF